VTKHTHPLLSYGHPSGCGGGDGGGGGSPEEAGVPSSTQLFKTGNLPFYTYLILESLYEEQTKHLH